VHPCIYSRATKIAFHVEQSERTGVSRRTCGCSCVRLSQVPTNHDRRAKDPNSETSEPPPLNAVALYQGATGEPTQCVGRAPKRAQKMSGLQPLTACSAGLQTGCRAGLPTRTCQPTTTRGAPGLDPETREPPPLNAVALYQGATGEPTQCVGRAPKRPQKSAGFSP